MSKFSTNVQNQVLEILGLKEFVFVESKLMEDGAKYLKCNGNAFAIGEEALIRDGSGAGETIAPDGEHKIETGETVVVKAGKISEIKKGEKADNGAKLPADKKQEAMSTEIKAENELPAELATPDAVPAEEAPKKEEVKALDEAAVKDLIMAALAPILDKLAELEGGATEMKTDVQKFAKAPAATPVKKTEVMSAKERYNSKIEELSAFLRK